MHLSFIRTAKRHGLDPYHSIISKKKWSQEKAASVLNVTQPKISLLSRGQFSGFSLGKLINLLSKLNQDIEIVVKNRSSSKRNHVGHVTVTYL